MYRELGEAAWAWVLGQVRDDEGPWLRGAGSGDEPPDDRDSVWTPRRTAPGSSGRAGCCTAPAPWQTPSPSA